MPQVKPNEEDLDLRETRALEWKMFRKNNLLTQKRLAATLNISRRTIQQVEGGYINPHKETLRRFEVLKAKYDAASAIET